LTEADTVRAFVDAAAALLDAIEEHRGHGRGEECSGRLTRCISDEAYEAREARWLMQRWRGVA
jgi:hypothetical protein